ncbi:MAG: DEAD/DEAH box helicase, partial [Chloroflexota bacterium]
IPAITYRQLAPADARRGKRTGEALRELHYGWQWVSDDYEAVIKEYAAGMPAAGAAGSTSAERRRLYASEPLLRHAAECLLHDAVTGTPHTAKFDQQLAGSLLQRCLSPSSATPSPPAAAEWTEFQQWSAWRQRLADRQTIAGFTLCFRLIEAPPDATGTWQMQFLVASKEDPSLKLSLDDYWRLDASARAGQERHFGAEFQQHLLLALGYAARIYPKIWDGLRGAQPTGCVLTLEEAFAFLRENAWVLQDAGFAVLVPSWYTPEGRRRAKVRLKTALHSTSSGSAPARRYLSLDTVIAYEYELAIGGEAVSAEEWRQLVAAKAPLVHFRGQWMELNGEKMQQMLTFWQSRRQEQPEFALLDMLQIAADDEDVEWEHDQAMLAMLERLDDKASIAPLADPPNLQGTLREYQRRGVAWLQYLERLGLNPCLADDMGLGKTIQVIACLLSEKAVGSAQAPTLLVAPTSVLGNWRKEIERFGPDLRTHVHQGGRRLTDERAFRDACRGCDVVITSFALARLDEKLLRSIKWQRLVIDEAQNIKNPQAAQTRAIQKLAAPHRIALTGTPVENRLRDLWSIFQFLNPGYLGKEAQFRKTFELPIQKENDRQQAAILKKLVEPFILRRLKTDKQIIDDLPDKVEQKLYCNLTPEQASLYEAVVKDVEEQLEEADGIGRRGLILATLMRLKQVCNHPAQFLQDGSEFSPERSQKLQRLTEMAAEALEAGESMLIFTQFTEIGAALERHLRRTLHRPVFYLHGGTSAAKRDQMVTQFQNAEQEPAIFILSLRAGGTGLTLTKASHVFHFDRWWNPAVENQATDRAFRIGQRRTVFVHTFIALGTVEERIDAMIEEKKHLASAIVGNDESWLTELDNATFKELIALRRDSLEAAA